jgi:flagellar hook protein FlgE
MSMSTALSGLMAAQTEISATSHNIANVATTGFHSSRVEFGDVFSASTLSAQRTAVGSGVQVQRVVQDFTQGNVVTTGSLLDFAIDGQGFFALQPVVDRNGVVAAPIFSRAGALTMDAQGDVVNGSSQSLLCWPVDVNGEPLTSDLRQAIPLNIPMQRGEPVGTSQIDLNVALPSDDAMLGSQDAVPPSAAFDPDDPTTYARRTVVPMFNSLGQPASAEAYFIKIASPDALSTDTVYEVRILVEGEPLVQSDPLVDPQITLDATGEIAGAATVSFQNSGVPLTINLAGSSLTVSPFSVQNVSHDGSAAARLSSIDVDNSGSVWATYGPDDRLAVGQIILATFSNPQGLKVLGKSSFAATNESGPPTTGMPGSAGFGLLRSGALERSNVELTAELVNLISAQRNYQASAKAMETSTSLMQTIMNIRG